jgi:hypothetical protein
MRELSRPTWMHAAALVLAPLLAACGQGEDGAGPSEPRSGRNDLVAEVASYELIVGEENRFIVGLLTSRNQFVSGGTVAMRFSFLGEGEAPEFYQELKGTFLQIEDGQGPPPERVTVGPASIGRGVYAANPVTFDRAGIWQVAVEADLGGGDLRTAITHFQVLDEPLVPAPGQEAPRTENLTTGSTGAPAVAIDSRADTKGKIPDAKLHQTTIAEAIEAGRPALVVFATPVYCVSRFCGPITDMVATLADEYANRAAFIHVEIWRDFQKQVVNKAAAEWVLREGEITEPWVFLIGGDGRIVARWDNVATAEEIEPLLRKLPTAG